MRIMNSYPRAYWIAASPSNTHEKGAREKPVPDTQMFLKSPMHSSYSWWSCSLSTPFLAIVSQNYQCHGVLSSCFIRGSKILSLSTQVMDDAHWNLAALTQLNLCWTKLMGFATIEMLPRHLHRYSRTVITSDTFQHKQPAKIMHFGQRHVGAM